ncbi:MAG TPA: pilus assembly protein PilM [Phycisphaerae bacterium]|nr:pilus assembly protein PilM [Phycisphaerae bacterium]
MRQLPIGLDVGTTAVRVLQVGGGERDLRVVDAAKFVIPLDVKDDAARRRKFVIDGIRRLVKECRFRGRDVVMALSAGELAVRNIRMPRMPEEELVTAVNWEAQNKFPFDTATAVIQYLRAGEVRHGDQILDEIILFAAPRAEVDEKIRLACETGLHLVSLDAEPCTVFRGFERFLRRRDDEDAVHVFSDIGADTTMVVARGRDIVFVKTIPIGGAVFNRAVADCLELAPAEAEALRRRIARRRAQGDDEGPEANRADRAVADAIRPHLEDLADEVGLCLRYYSVTFRGPRPGSILFTGGEAHDPSIPAALGDRLGMEIEVGDPFRGVRTDHLDPILDRRGVRAEWATAFGLSLKGFHLAAQFAAGYAA